MSEVFEGGRVWLQRAMENGSNDIVKSRAMLAFAENDLPAAEDYTLAWIALERDRLNTKVRSEDEMRYWLYEFNHPLRLGEERYWALVDRAAKAGASDWLIAYLVRHMTQMRVVNPNNRDWHQWLGDFGIGETDFRVTWAWVYFRRRDPRAALALLMSVSPQTHEQHVAQLLEITHLLWFVTVSGLRADGATTEEQQFAHELGGVQRLHENSQELVRRLLAVQTDTLPYWQRTYGSQALGTLEKYWLVDCEPAESELASGLRQARAHLIGLSEEATATVLAREDATYGVRTDAVPA